MSGKINSKYNIFITSYLQLITLVYNLGIYVFPFLIYLSSVFGNRKAKQWIEGRRNVLDSMQQQLKPNEKRIWLHAASLGEFEQGRPLLEKIREQYPEYKIFLTFFSPSGFEIRKNYSGADYIFYLPNDTPRNATKFIDLVNPQMVLFVKYEFWYNYLAKLKSRNIPVYLCSAIFRDQQVFFSWYGIWFRKMLSFFTHFFVQTNKSELLLQSIGFRNSTVVGDTRFDRVFSISSQVREIEEVKAFVGKSDCLIAGSTWTPDEELLISFINKSPLPVKYIIAPHEIDSAHISRLENSLPNTAIRYSQWKLNPAGNYKVLIIDNIGMLSSLYRYGKVAYIGGGFGKGIHNILEAATFGLPVIFGPNHRKFSEAVELCRRKGAFAIKNYSDVETTINQLFENKAYLEACGDISYNFVKENVGASEKIISTIMN